MTLQGLQVIRVYKMEDHFIMDFDWYHDHQTAAMYLFNATYRWFGNRTDYVVSLYLTTCLIAAVLVPKASEYM